MNEKELKQFTTLLDKFIDFCGMDYMNALQKAIELRNIIIENN